MADKTRLTALVRCDVSDLWQVGADSSDVTDRCWLDLGIDDTQSGGVGVSIGGTRADLLALLAKARSAVLALDNIEREEAEADA